MHVQSSKTYANRNRVSGFLRLFVLSLLSAAFSFTSLHAQTVAYVVNFGSNSVSVIDTSTNAVTATIPVGNGPAGVVFSPDGTRAYVTNSPDGTISVIDTGSNTVTATITVEIGSPDLDLPAITPDGKSLYVPDQDHGLFVVSTATNNVVATIPVPGIAVAITPDGTRAYLQTGFSSSTGIPVIDTATNTIVTTITGVPGGFFASGIADTPNGLTIYATGGSAGVVSAIATSSNTLTATIPVNGFPAGIAITPDSSRAYVVSTSASSGPDVVNIIDTSTNTLEAGSITIGNTFPGLEAFLAVTPDGAFVYATNVGDNTVSVIATATNTVLATVSVGILPVGIASANLNAPFASFPAPTPSSPTNANKISLSGSLSLGANSQGLDFAHQPMTLTVGGFSLLFPAGTVTQVGNGSQQHFTFSGTLNGLSVTFDLIGNSPNFSYNVTIQGKNVKAQVGPNPVTVSLAIGSNSGSSTVNF